MAWRARGTPLWKWEAQFAFAFVPGNEKIDIEYGVTHAGSGAGNSAPGSMQHIALNVDTPEDLLAMRDRIRSRGINVLGRYSMDYANRFISAGRKVWR